MRQLLNRLRILIARFAHKREQRQCYGVLMPRTSLITKATGQKFRAGQWARRNEPYPIGTPWWKTYPQDAQDKAEKDDRASC